MRILESTIQLLSSLFLIALISLIAFCVFGSVVAALRAVSQRGGTSTTHRQVATANLRGGSK